MSSLSDQVIDQFTFTRVLIVVKLTFEPGIIRLCKGNALSGHTCFGVNIHQKRIKYNDGLARTIVDSEPKKAGPPFRKPAFICQVWSVLVFVGAEFDPAPANTTKTQPVHHRYHHQRQEGGEGQTVDHSPGQWAPERDVVSSDEDMWIRL